MRKTYKTLTLITLLCLGSISAQGADEKAIAALKSAGIDRVGWTRQNGTCVSIPAAKLTEETWKLIESLTDLKSFASSGKEFDDAALARLAKIKMIESLGFNAPSFTDKGLAVLSQFPKLRKYGTDHGGFTGSGFASLAGLKDFQAFSFNGSGLDDAGMEAIGGLVHLRELSAYHDRYTSKGFANLAKLTELEKLKLAPANSPYYTGADFIHLSGLTNLQELWISQMVIGYDDGLSHLKPLRKLKKLSLIACGVTEEDLAKLKADHPDTIIEFTPAKPEIIKQWNESLAKKKAGK